MTGPPYGDLITEISTSLLRAQPSHIDDRIEEFLRRLAEFYALDGLGIRWGFRISTNPAVNTLTRLT